MPNPQADRLRPLAHTDIVELMHNDDTMIRGWALALRDLCEQGAVRVTARFENGATMDYRLGEGARLAVDGRVLTMAEDTLDYVGLMPVTEEERPRVTFTTGEEPAYVGPQRWGGVRTASLGGSSAKGAGGEEDGPDQRRKTAPRPVSTTPAPHKMHSPHERGDRA